MPHTLESTLRERTWRELRATAHAHGLRFNTNLDKDAAHARLHGELRAGQLRRSFRALDLPERAALAALQAAGGSLPLPQFAAAFGAIRPYKPWRMDAPVHPWRRPVSPAERLWFLGFVHIVKGENGRPRTVQAPTEVLALLPPLPRPRPRRACLPRPSRTPGALLVDLAALLGTLLYTPVPPRWGRWLPPWALKAVNARLRWPEDVAAPESQLRSELHTRRTRFLHYLAEVAGLVSIQGGVLLPTPAAWGWLALPPGAQWRALFDAWTRDTGAREPLAARYRFPAIAPRVWEALIMMLGDLAPGRTYTLRDVVRALAPYAVVSPHPRATCGRVTPSPTGGEGEEFPSLRLRGGGVRGGGQMRACASVPGLLRGPLAWAGIVEVRGERFTLGAAGCAALRAEPDAFAAPGDAAITFEAGALWVTLPDMPRLRPYVDLLAWATVDHRRVCVDAAAVRRAVAGGLDAIGIAQTLAALSGEPLPRDVFAQIEAWERGSRRFVLRQMTVLTSPDGDLLAQLRQDRRLRPLFVETLGAHHVAVQPHATDDLRQSLARRGYQVTVPGRAADAVPSGALTPELAAYLWLAVRVTRHLRAFVDLPVAIPGAVEHWLAGYLPEDVPGGLAQTAAAIQADLARAIDGYAAFPAPLAPEDPAGIRAAVEGAIRTRGALTVEYLSPGYGAPVIRTIEPLMPVTESGGADYLEAWCRTAQAARTFRLDRIVRVLDS